MSDSVFSALRERYAPPTYAYFEEVRNGTGYARRTTRTADGLAMGLWPSRGLELIGVEVKTARSDWLRELKEPEKAEEIGRFCDRWFLATATDVARLEEIPPAWGWLELKAGKLKVRKDAPQRDGILQIDRPMLAAILRKASEGQNGAVLRAIQAGIDERWKREQADRESERAEWRKTDSENHTLRALVHDLRSRFGLELTGDRVTESDRDNLDLLKQGEIDRLRNQARHAASQLRGIATRARQILRAGGVRSHGRGW